MAQTFAHNKKIAILGFGVEGQGTLAYLRKHGYTDITVVDQRVDIDVPEGVAVVTGPTAMESLSSAEVIFRSPGIYRRHPAILVAEQSGAVVTSQLEYFLARATCTVIGVTGTKGKSTTSSLLYHILKEGGKDVYLAGNIGQSLIGLLDEIAVGSTVVLELSSFQLQDCHESPRVAIVLGITPEHQDVHGSMEEYVMAKAAIAQHQGEGDMLLCAPDNEPAAQIAGMSVARQRWSWCVHGDGCALPQDCQCGASMRDGALYLHTGAEPVHLMDRQDIPVLGDHMLHNVLPAVLCAHLAGIPQETLAGAVRRFPGVPYRMEFVGEALGMRFYNDSAATTPEAAMAGLDAHAGHPTILVLGGGQKGVSLDALVKHVARAPHLAGLILLGTDAAPLLEKALRSKGFEKPLHMCTSMDAVAALLPSLAQPGTRVVLSPGFSSFDLFRNYKERGDVFKAMIQKLQ